MDNPNFQGRSFAALRMTVGLVSVLYSRSGQQVTTVTLQPGLVGFH